MRLFLSSLILAYLVAVTCAEYCKKDECTTESGECKKARDKWEENCQLKTCVQDKKTMEMKVVVLKTLGCLTPEGDCKKIGETWEDEKCKLNKCIKEMKTGMLKIIVIKSGCLIEDKCYMKPYKNNDKVTCTFTTCKPLKKDGTPEVKVKKLCKVNGKCKKKWFDKKACIKYICKDGKAEVRVKLCKSANGKCKPCKKG